jgi:hypothetical protein
MPPKKDKKKKVSRKKVRMAMPDPARFATGYNRQIPGGVIGTGGGGGFVAPSYSVGGYASRMPPPATPIQTPDQFSIIQQQAKQSKAIEDIVEEQAQARRGRKTDAEKAEALGQTVEELRAQRKAKRVPATPLGTMTMTEQVKMPTAPMDMLPPQTPPPAMADSNIRKAGRKKKQEVAGDTPASSFASPSVISSPEYPGGQNMNQQGMFMGTSAKLKGSPPDISTDLDGTLDAINEPAVFLG